MSLSPVQKCLVRFIFDKCDQAGVWCPNWRLASVYIGEPVEWSDVAALGIFEQLPNGKIWIPKFTKFQYGELKPSSPPHKKAIDILQSNGVLDRVSNTLSNGVSDTPQDMDKDIDKDKEEDEAKPKRGSGGKTTIDPAALIPEGWSRQEFLDYWADFEKVRKSKKKQLTDIAVKRLVTSLVRFSGGEWYKAKAIMEKTIVGAWDAFYELKPGDLATVEAEKPVEYGVWVNGKKVS